MDAVKTTMARKEKRILSEMISDSSRGFRIIAWMVKDGLHLYLVLITCVE
jgi:hypothetical protein